MHKGWAHNIFEISPYQPFIKMSKATNYVNDATNADIVDFEEQV